MATLLRKGRLNLFTWSRRRLHRRTAIVSALSATV